MTVDHMESQDICGVKGVDRTRCGQKVNSTPGYVFEYGSPKTTCKACLRLHAKDQMNLSKSKGKPGLPRRYYKCARTDCGVAGCECSSLDPDPPEFCVYDNDEAHWDEIKRSDDQ